MRRRFPGVNPRAVETLGESCGSFEALLDGFDLQIHVSVAGLGELRRLGFIVDGPLLHQFVDQFRDWWDWSSSNCW